MSSLGPPPPLGSSLGSPPPLGTRKPYTGYVGPQGEIQERGLEEDDPLSPLVWALTAALTGGASLPAMAGAAAADVGFKAASSAMEGAPWWVRIPTELAGMVAGGKIGHRLGGGLKLPKGVTREEVKGLLEEAAKTKTPSYKTVPEEGAYVRTPEVEPNAGLVSSGRKQVFRISPTGEIELANPERALEPPSTYGTVVSGEWPNIKATRGLIKELPKESRSNVEGQWPNVRSVSPTLKGEDVTAPNKTWAELLRTKEEPPVEVRIKPPTVQERAAQVEAKLAADKAEQSVWGDIKNLGGGLRSGVGHYLSTVLTQIEREAGQEIGSQLTALEGQQAQRSSQIWQELFGPLTDTLRRLPKQYYNNFVDTLEGKTTAANEVIGHAVEEFRKVFGVEGSSIMAHKRAGIDIEPMENYFMHEFEPAFMRGMYNDPQRQTTIARQMVADGVALDQAQARRMIGEWMGSSSRALYRNRPSGAEFDRVVSLTNYIRDPLKAVTMRGRAISRRLAEAEVYGDKKEYVHKLINQLEPDKASRVVELMRLTMGRDPVTEGVRKAVGALMSFQAISSLSLSGIMNASQPTLLALRTSLPAMAKAVFSTVAHPNQSWAAARQLGIYADMAQRQLLLEMSGGAGGFMARNSLRLFNITERFVRAMAAEGGKEWAATLQQRLVRATPENAPPLIRELIRLNFTKPEVERLMATKQLTPRDVQLIQWSVADQISFLPRPGRKSEFYLQSPLGPVLLQFKGFLMNTGRLLKQAITDEYRAGNYAPLARLGIVLPVMAAIGEPFADVNAALRGSRRPTTDLSNPLSIVNRGIDNIAQIGALGLGLGLLQEMTGIKTTDYRSDLLGTLAGPTAGMLAKDVPYPFAALKALAQGDRPEAQKQVYETGRRVLRRIPYIGPYAANEAFPSSAETPSMRNDTVWDKLGLTQKAVTREKLRRMNSRLRHLTNP